VVENLEDVNSSSWLDEWRRLALEGKGFAYRWMSGVTREDGIRNKYVRGSILV